MPLNFLKFQLFLINLLSKYIINACEQDEKCGVIVFHEAYQTKYMSNLYQVVGFFTLNILVKTCLISRNYKIHALRWGEMLSEVSANAS